MNNQYDDNFIRMEKKSSNKRGIIILIVVVLIIIVVSGFYFSKNGLSLEFKLPWQTEERKTSDNDKDKNGSSKNPSSTSYDPPSFADKELENSSTSYSLSFSSFSKTNLGYNMDITFATKDYPYTLTLEKLLVDGYDTTTTFSRSLNPHESVTQTIRINQSELDALDIVSFSKITLYFNEVDANGKSNIRRYQLTSTGRTSPNNARIGLVEIDDKNQTKVSYYKTLEDKDNTYIYFDFKNSATIRNQLVSVKKLTINGELYDYPELNETVYHGAEKIISLTIPKKKFSKVKYFTVSFTMLNEESGKKTAVYITNEYNKTI